MISPRGGARSAGVAVVLCAAFAGCTRSEVGFGTRWLSGDSPAAHAVNVLSFALPASPTGRFSTTGPLSIEGFAVMDLAVTGFEAGDIFVDEVRGGARVFPIQGRVRPFVGFGMSMGLYMKTLPDADVEMDFGLGVLGSVGVEMGEPGKFLVGVEASYLANSASDYGGSQVMVSLVFKQ